MHHQPIHIAARNVTRWCPPVISWFIIPLTIDISLTKTIVIGVIGTNLAIVWGDPPCTDSLPMGNSPNLSDAPCGHVFPGEIHIAVDLEVS